MFATFFTHKKCEFFPCHKTENPENFNCLFCYCPLYTLGKFCGGNFDYMKNGTKSCVNCEIPHKKNSAEYIKNRFGELSELANFYSETKSEE
jgi:Zn-finger protein